MSLYRFDPWAYNIQHVVNWGLKVKCCTSCSYKILTNTPLKCVNVLYHIIISVQNVRMFGGNTQIFRRMQELPIPLSRNSTTHLVIDCPWRRIRSAFKKLLYIQWYDCLEYKYPDVIMIMVPISGESVPLSRSYYTSNDMTASQEVVIHPMIWLRRI